MMRALTLIAMATASLTSAPALAQEGGNPRGGPIGGSGDTGNAVLGFDTRSSAILATSPSRMPRSRREMNRGLEATWASNPTPTQIRSATERAILRGGLHCTIADLTMVAQLRDGTPLVEVACEEDGGLVIADSTPIRVADCFDLASGDAALEPCRLPQNVARVAGARQ